MRNICKSLRKYGVCLEQFHPYKESDVFKKPSWLAYFCARFYRIKNYYRCNNKQEVKQALVNGLTVVIGFQVYQNLFSYNGGIYGSTSGRSVGGHAVTILAYDNNKKCFIIKNSWGKKWGDKG